MNMQVRLGDEVITRDGKNVGKIDKLILDPKDHTIRAAVVRKGVFFTDDVEIRLDLLEVERDGEVRLLCTEDEYERLPKFYESSYTTSPPPGYAAPYDYPLGGFVWPGGGVYPVVGAPLPAYPLGTEATDPEIGADRDAQQILREQDLRNAVIDEGSDVKGIDGEKIGELHSLTFDPDTGHLTSFVVRKGFLFTQDHRLPADLISSVDDGVVYLKLDKEQLEQRLLRAAP
jgi:sporulation protein YlmC with PRC-barrel domain